MIRVVQEQILSQVGSARKGVYTIQSNNYVHWGRDHGVRSITKGYEWFGGH